MVSTTTRDEMTWYECEACGLLFDSKEDAKQHEQTCDAEEPSYIHTDGCKKPSNLATPGWRGCSRIYSRQYQ